MSFTCLKCAKCMGEVVGGIDWAIELKKPSTPIFRGECCENCLSVEKRINRGQHYVALALWRERRKIGRHFDDPRDDVIGKTMTMTNEEIKKVLELADELFNDDKIHTKILEENYRRLKSARAIKILLVDDKERAVLSLRKKIEEQKS